MNALMSTPADCEVRGVIRFLQAENVRPCEIHQRLVAVYGEHVMNAASVRKWCTQCLRMGEQMFMTLRDQDDLMNRQAAVWYEEEISELFSRYDKCLSVQGDCVEK